MSVNVKNEIHKNQLCLNSNHRIPEHIFQAYSQIIFFDCETTGLKSKTDKIIELAASKISVSGTSDFMDSFVAIDDATPLPAIVTQITGITREYLCKHGITEQELVKQFLEFVETDGKTLFVAHNANFDLLFLLEMLKRNKCKLQDWDAIDTLTVFKDRSKYPHKLADAIRYYKLNEVQNSHLAREDVNALSAVFFEMIEECDDLHKYINLFGMHPKGLDIERIPGIIYHVQQFRSKTKLYDLVHVMT